MSTSSFAPRVPTSALITLHVLAFVAGPWALYQWMELLVAQDGGTIACAISETLNCAEVWSMPLAKSVHRLSGLPLAGWGLVWAFVALVAPLRLAMDLLQGRRAEPGIFGVRLVAAGGGLTSLGLLGLSVAKGVYCPTCLATYVIVLAYGLVAFFALRPQDAALEPVSAVFPLAAAVTAGWLILLWPGLKTPVDAASETALTPGRVAGEGPTQPRSELESVVAELPPPGKAMLAEAIQSLRSEPATVDVKPRRRHGPADAPILITDFSDLRCGHCRNLALALETLRERFGDRFAEDARYFPLSARCNSEIPDALVDETGVRCLAAKVLLCLEDDPKYFELRRRLFEAQSELTREEVVRIAVDATEADEAAVTACETSEAVQAKLQEDIDYAQRHNIRGTPLVLLNGRPVPAHPRILYALLLAGASPDHPAFAGLADMKSP